jgi:hypothetical protein
VPTLGGSPRRVVSGRYPVPSPDGAFIYYSKSDSTGIFRSGKSGLNEELVYNSEGSGLSFFPTLLFPGGTDLLAVGYPPTFGPKFRFYRINVTDHEAVNLGEVSGGEVVWAEPGNSALFSRTINGLTNIWKYNLQDCGTIPLPTLFFSCNLLSSVRSSLNPGPVGTDVRALQTHSWHQPTPPGTPH